MTDLMAPLWAALPDRYRFERQLGAGGMANVYLAHDLRHDRPVAVKVLRPELAKEIGAERFLNEIKITANLHHPHILPLHDSGEAGGFLFYVMPYIEGESLRDRLTQEKQLPIADAVRITTEVATALDYAHRHGVIHRDIKPENILLHDGRALVADFGISRAVSNARGTRLTETGMSLGTPHYMSPEQAMGERDITPRSDIYSLGATLYEMLVGEPPFTGPTAQAIVARVLTEEARGIAPQRRTVPPAVEAAVLTSLAKLPADRFPTAAAFAAALQDPSYALPGIRQDTPSRYRPRSWTTRLVPWALVVVAIGLVVVNGLRSKFAPPPPVYRFDLMLPATAAWVGDVSSVPALSPDGSLLVYNGKDSTAQRRLYLRAMDRLDPVPIPGSEDGTSPVFSPDGRWVAFTLGTRIVKTAVSGGSPATVCSVGSLPRATWLESNIIVFTDKVGLRSCSTKGDVSTLVASDSTESFYAPHVLPADRGVLFSIERESGSRLAVYDLRARTVRPLDIAGSDPRYVASGYLVYLSPDGLLRAVRFDAKSLKSLGEPVMLDAQVRVDIGQAVMALSRSGTIVVPSGATQQMLALVDRSGRAERLYPRLGDYGEPRVSRDGRRIAVRLGKGIWVLDRAQGTLSRLSADSGASRPAWSSDGKRVGYVRQKGATIDLRWVGADGGAPAESLLALPDRELWEVLFLPNKESMVVRTVGGAGRRDIWLVPSDARGRLVPVLTTPANEVSPTLSGDGRWLAYVSDESGRAEVYVRAFPSGAGRYQVSLDGGTEPVWSRRGDELFFRSGPALIAAVVQAGPAFEVTRRTVLFSDGSYAEDLTHAVYDVMPDARHFVMVRRAEPTSHLTVTLNLFENLRRAATGVAQPARAR